MSTTIPETLFGVPVQRKGDKNDQTASPNQSSASNEAADALVEGPGKKTSARERKSVTKPKVTAERKRRNMDAPLSQSVSPSGGTDAPGQPSSAAAANARRELISQPADEGISLGELAARGPQPRISPPLAHGRPLFNNLLARVSSTSSWMTSSLFVVGLDRTARFGRYFETFTSSKAMAALIYVLSGLLTVVGVMLFMLLTVVLGIIAAVIIGLVILTEDLYYGFDFVRQRTSGWFQRRLPKETTADIAA